MYRLLEGLLNALARLIEHPTVVHATQTVLFRYPVGEVDTTVWAGSIDEAIGARPVLVENEVLGQ
jgi:hypothetical protein